LRNLILLLLETKSTSHPTAVRFDVVELKAGDEPEDLNGRETDPKSSQMTWSKIGSPQRDLLKFGVEIP